jgi:aspartate carbamoyltransferase catalytic subunit
MVAAEKFGMEISLCGPETLVPKSQKSFVREMPFDEALPKVDAVMMLRIQLERHEGLELNKERYHRDFGLTTERLAKMKKSAIVLHPGPFNRGVEISDEIVEHPQSRIFKQMENGVYARMAILEWAMGQR